MSGAAEPLKWETLRGHRLFEVFISQMQPTPGATYPHRRNARIMVVCDTPDEAIAAVREAFPPSEHPKLQVNSVVPRGGGHQPGLDPDKDPFALLVRGGGK